MFWEGKVKKGREVINVYLGIIKIKVICIDKPQAKFQSQSQSNSKGKGSLASGLSLKSYGSPYRCPDLSHSR